MKKNDEMHRRRVLFGFNVAKNAPAPWRLGSAGTAGEGMHTHTHVGGGRRGAEIVLGDAIQRFFKSPNL